MTAKMLYSGVFSALCEEFIVQKRALGYRYIEEERQMKRFAKFCQERGLQKQILSRGLVEAWTEKRPHETAKNRESRATVIVNSLVFWKPEDIKFMFCHSKEKRVPPISFLTFSRPPKSAKS
ncbi:MAG: hypothetical protein FWG74_02565 [Planctomycetes bacterium]|nr:hypothetical protein [Planctomycetota bacterium]